MTDGRAIAYSEREHEFANKIANLLSTNCVNHSALYCSVVFDHVLLANNFAKWQRWMQINSAEHGWVIENFTERSLIIRRSAQVVEDM